MKKIQPSGLLKKLFWSWKTFWKRLYLQKTKSYFWIGWHFPDVLFTKYCFDVSQRSCLVLSRSNDAGFSCHFAKWMHLDPKLTNFTNTYPNPVHVQTCPGLEGSGQTCPDLARPVQRQSKKISPSWQDELFYRFFKVSYLLLLLSTTNKSPWALSGLTFALHRGFVHDNTELCQTEPW